MWGLETNFLENTGLGARAFIPFLSLGLQQLAHLGPFTSPQAGLPALHLLADAAFAHLNAHFYKLVSRASRSANISGLILNDSPGNGAPG